MKEPTLAECVEVLREMKRGTESVLDERDQYTTEFVALVRAKYAALARAIEVCERVQRGDDAYPDLRSQTRDVQTFNAGARTALAWARGER